MDKPEEVKQPLIMKTPEGTYWVSMPDYETELKRRVDAESKIAIYQEQEKRWLSQMKVKDFDACNTLIDALEIQGKKLAEVEDKFNKLQAHHAEMYSKAERLVEAAKSLTTWIKAKGGHGYETHGLSENLEQAIKEYMGEK